MKWNIAHNAERIILSGYGENEFNIPACPAYSDGILYLPTSTGGVRAVDADSLTELHSFECGESLLAVCPYTKIGTHAALGTPLIDGGRIIFGAADGFVYAYDKASYELLWTASVGHPVLSSVIKIPVGYAVCDFDGGVSFIEK